MGLGTLPSLIREPAAREFLVDLRQQGLPRELGAYVAQHRVHGGFGRFPGDAGAMGRDDGVLQLKQLRWHSGFALMCSARIRCQAEP